MKFAKLLIVIAVLVSLLVVSLLIKDVYFNGGIDEPSNSESVSNDDLLQYEWPQIHGDSGFTRYSEGPAPESSDILCYRWLLQSQRIRHHKRHI